MYLVDLYIIVIWFIVDAANKCCWQRCKLKRKNIHNILMYFAGDQYMRNSSELAFLVVESLEHARSCEAKVSMISDRFTLQYNVYNFVLNMLL